MSCHVRWFLVEIPPLRETWSFPQHLQQVLLFALRISQKTAPFLEPREAEHDPQAELLTTFPQGRKHDSPQTTSCRRTLGTVRYVRFRGLPIIHATIAGACGCIMIQKVWDQHQTNKNTPFFTRCLKVFGTHETFTKKQRVHGCRLPPKIYLSQISGWWKKSYTTCYLWNPMKNGIFSISAG